MPGCVVKWCRNHSGLKCPGITFHYFPAAPNQLNRWIAAVKLERREFDWMPLKGSRLCSVHFEEKDFYKSLRGYTMLHKTAVPVCTMIRPEETSSFLRDTTENENINNNERLEFVCNANVDSPSANKTNTSDPQASPKQKVQKRKLVDKNMSELDKFKRRLIRAVARLKLSDKVPEDELWETLKQETGCDCKLLWERMRALTMKKMKRLLAADDKTENIAAVARMSLTDWLLFDLVLVHEKIDVIGREKLNDSKTEYKPLMELFSLVQRFEIEGKTGSDLAEMWAIATVYYNSRGHQCSPMLLQRRWYQLKELARDKFYKFWLNYRGNAKLLAKVLDFKPTRLQMAIAKRYPHVVTQSFTQWEDLIKEGNVILPEVFETKMRNLSLKKTSNDNVPDVVLVEPEIETINLGEDSDTEDVSVARQGDTSVVNNDQENSNGIQDITESERAVDEVATPTNMEIDLGIIIKKEVMDDTNESNVELPGTMESTDVVLEVEQNDPSVKSIKVENTVANTCDESLPKITEVIGNTKEPIVSKACDDMLDDIMNMGEEDSVPKFDSNLYENVKKEPETSSEPILPLITNVCGNVQLVSEPENLEAESLEHDDPAPKNLEPGGLEAESLEPEGVESECIESECIGPESLEPEIQSQETNETNYITENNDIDLITEVYIKVQTDVQIQRRTDSIAKTSDIDNQIILEDTPEIESEDVDMSKQNNDENEDGDLEDIIQQKVDDLLQKPNVNTPEMESEVVNVSKQNNDENEYDDLEDIIKQKVDDFLQKPNVNTPEMESENVDVSKQKNDANDDVDLEDIIKQKVDDFLQKPSVNNDNADSVTVGETLKDITVDLDFIDDGIEFIDDGIEYNDGVVENKVEVKIEPQTEENDSNVDNDLEENNTAKFDLKLLMDPVVYTTKLESMKILKNVKDIVDETISDRSIIDMIFMESKPVSRRAIDVDTIKKEEQVHIQSLECCEQENDDSKIYSDDESEGDIKIKDDQRVKINSKLLQKPRSRTYNPIQLCKNPDFNTTLKRLTLGFFSSMRNRQLLKACKPMTIDVSKVFESRLIDGTLYLKISDTLVKQDIEEGKPESTQKSSVVPSALPVQSLIDNMKMTTDVMMSEISPIKLTEESPVNERRKVINLPDITQVRRNNQKLLTAEVTPMRVHDSTTACEPPVQIVSNRNINSAVNTNTIFPTGPKSTVISDVINNKVKKKVDTSNIIGKKLQTDAPTPSQIKDLKKKINSRNAVFAPWLIQKQTVYNPNDFLLTTDTLYKMLHVMGDPNPWKNAIVSGVSVPKNKKTKVGQEQPKSQNLEETKNQVPQGKDDKVPINYIRKDLIKEKPKKPPTKPKIKIVSANKKPCCWARNEIIKLQQNRRTSKHNCPLPNCKCCCWDDFIKVTSSPTSESNKSEENNTIDLCEDDVSLKKACESIETVVRQSDQTSEVGQIPVVTIDITSKDSVPTVETQNPAKVGMISVKPLPSLILDSADNSKETMPIMEDDNTKSIQTKPVEHHIAEPRMEPVEPPILLEPDLQNSDNLAQKMEPAVNIIVKPRIRGKNVIRATRIAVPQIDDVYSPVSPLVQNMFKPKSYTKQIMNSRQLVIDGSKGSLLETLVQERVENERVIYLNSKHLSKRPTESPVFIGKNKILLATVKFPSNLTDLNPATEATKAVVKPTIAVPDGVQIVLLPDGNLSYTVSPDAKLSADELACLPSLLAAIKQQLSSTIGTSLNANSINSTMTTGSTEVINLDDETSENTCLISNNATTQRQLSVNDTSTSNKDNKTEKSEGINKDTVTEIDNTTDKDIIDESNFATDTSNSENSQSQVLINMNENALSNITSENISDNSSTNTNNINTSNSSTETELQTRDASSITTEQIPKISDTCGNNTTKNHVENSTLDIANDRESKDNESTSESNNSNTLDKNVSYSETTSTNRKSLLSDLMEMSGISAEDSIPPEENVHHDNVSDTSKTIDLNYNADPETIELNPVTCFAELKYACANNSQFFKLDLETGMIVPINVCIKKNRSKEQPIRTISKSVIDLTDDADSETPISKKKKVEVSPRSLLKRPLSENSSNESVRPLKMFKSTIPILLKRKQLEKLSSIQRKIKEIKSLPKDIRKKVINIQVNEIDTSINLVDSDAPMEEEYLLENYDSESEEIEQRASNTCDDDSSDDEPLANIAKRMRPNEGHSAENNAATLIDDTNPAKNDAEVDKGDVNIEDENVRDITSAVTFISDNSDCEVSEDCILGF